jgi:hypothetical protein
VISLLTYLSLRLCPKIRNWIQDFGTLYNCMWEGVRLKVLLIRAAEIWTATYLVQVDRLLPGIKIFVWGTLKDFGQLCFVRWLVHITCMYATVMLVIACKYFTFKKVWYQAHIYSRKVNEWRYNWVISLLNTAYKLHTKIINTKLITEAVLSRGPE